MNHQNDIERLRARISEIELFIEQDTRILEERKAMLQTKEDEKQLPLVGLE